MPRSCGSGDAGGDRFGSSSEKLIGLLGGSSKSSGFSAFYKEEMKVTVSVQSPTFSTGSPSLCYSRPTLCQRLI